MLAVGTPRRHPTFEQRCKALAETYKPLCTLVPMVNPTAEGRSVQALKIANSAPDQPQTLFVGGIHGRELAPPDAILSLIEELLEKYKAGAAIKYPATKVTDTGGKVWNLPAKEFSADKVKAIVERLELYFVPLANPDGREWDLDHPAEWKGLVHDGWRKNRWKNPAFPLPGSGVNYSHGVDLNRNFPIAWEVKDYYNLGDYENEYPGKSPAGLTPAEETFRGESAASEPETKNVRDLVDSLTRLRLYIDVHAFGPTALYDWGIEDNGTDPKMSFLNPAKDKKRDGLPSTKPSPSGNPSYSEFVPEGEFGFRQNLRQVTTVMRDAIHAQTDPSLKKPAYVPQSCADLYRPGSGPTAGGSDDYAFSRQVAWDAVLGEAKASARAPIYSFTFEAGAATDGEFRPLYTSVTSDFTARAFPKVEREIHFGLLAALDWLAMRNAPPPKPPAPKRNPPGSSCCLTVLLTLATATAASGGVEPLLHSLAAVA